jgi:hypothetical protein
MRAWILGLVGVAALFSLPASAHRGHYRVIREPRPYVSLGYSFGYPFGYGYGYGYGLGLGYYPFGYSPYYYPWRYGPGLGVAVRVGPSGSRSRRVESSEGGTQQALKLYVYPAKGQSDKQTADDRYQCHLWAVDKSGYDPTLGAGKREDAENYTRAFTACMEGRDYVVK